MRKWVDPKWRPTHTWNEYDHSRVFAQYQRDAGLRRARQEHADKVRWASYLLPPGGKGYGHSTEWPFDIERAKRNPGYSRGINRAIGNESFHPAWRARAYDDMLRHVVPYVTMLANELQALEEIDPRDLFS